MYFTVDSDIPVNIRVKLVFNFIDDQGNILPNKPIEEIDYIMELNPEWLYKMDITIWMIILLVQARLY